MDEVRAFAVDVVTFVESTPWCKAFPFGESPCLSHPTPTYMFPGTVGNLNGVNPDNALLTSDGHPTSLAYYYFNH